jgi:hypothetical protein
MEYYKAITASRYFLYKTNQMVQNQTEQPNLMYPDIQSLWFSSGI